MGTRTHPDSEGLPYFVTFTTHERRRVFHDSEIAGQFVDHLHQLRDELGFLLIAHVVMPDHVHLILLPGPGHGLAELMKFIKGRFARVYNQRMGQGGRLWQPRYYESAIGGEAALMRQIAYVENNPVAAALVRNAEDFEFSSAGRETDLEHYLGEGPVPVVPG
jgi:putative transposase